MMNSASISAKLIAKKLFPFLLFVVALWAISDELLSIKDMKIPSLLEAWPIGSVLLIGSIFNWGLEAYKWHLLGSSSLSLSYGQALKGVLVGSAIGMWMPGRVGAWIGKLSFVASRDRKTALFPLMTSGAVQFFVTISAAIFSGCYFYFDQDIALFQLSNAKLIFYGGLFTLFFIAGALAFYAFLHSKHGRNLLHKLGLRNGKLLSIGELPRKLYGQVLALAYMRYSVFLLQFVLALNFWVPEASPYLFLAAVPLILFIVSVLPSFILAKLGVREMVILSVLAPFVGHEAELVLASFSIWVVNLALPAFFGACILLERSLSRPLSR